MKNYEIELSFVPYSSTLPSFTIYRRLRDGNDRKDSSEVFASSLPQKNDQSDRNNYWISFNNRKGYTPFLFNPYWNVHVTRRALNYSLIQLIDFNLHDVEQKKSGISVYKELVFNFKKHREGTEQLIIQPYYLREKKLFGWLLDYHFSLAQGAMFSKAVQRLSLSLDENFKRNLNAYIDREQKIVDFFAQRRSLIQSIRLPEENELPSLSDNFLSLPADILTPKVYYFSQNKSSRSQFSGLREFGPLKQLERTPKFVFIFEERHRPSARKLAAALVGSKELSTINFPGFNKLFKAAPVIDPNPIVIDAPSKNSYNLALKELKEKQGGAYTIIPILVIGEESENGYLEHKSIFAHSGIPTQACTLRVINDRNSLKWSVANIALQVFCKCGGTPWKVRPTSHDTVIIGISQAHKIFHTSEKTTIERFFAFSVMTDNSGIFQEIDILSENDSQQDYIDGLKRSLNQILNNAAIQYRRVVIHTSFRLKRAEIEAIEETVSSANQNNKETSCQFAVVKVNHRHRFFGFNRASNHLVPIEGSYLKLGRMEYLVWFEGVARSRSTVTKAYPGPTHIRILDVSSKNPIPDEVLLQDLLNLSGANWRGFNAKSSPVSVFYCHLIADLVRDFHEKGLPMPAVQDLKPWFL